MSAPLVWIHEDRLSPGNEALQAFPGAPAVFVFDDEYLAQTGHTLKRIVFLYECLLELPVEIHRGPMRETLERLRAEKGATRLITTESPNPRLRAIASDLGAEVVSVEPFVEARGAIDLKRFSRYWRRVEAKLLGDE